MRRKNIGGIMSHELKIGNLHLLCGLALGLSFASPSFAMGQGPSQGQLDKDQELQTIQKNQVEINQLNQELGHPAETLQLPQQPTIEQLHAIDSKQLSEIDQLLSQRDDKFTLDQADIEKKENDMIQNDKNLATDSWVEQRCSSLDDSLPSPDVSGRTDWARQCLANATNLLQRPRADEVSSHVIDPAIEDRYYTLVATMRLLSTEGDQPFGNTGRYWYPVFGWEDGNGLHNTDNTGKYDLGKSPTIHYVAPITSSDGCGTSYNGTDGSGHMGAKESVDLLNELKFNVVAMCVSGCYTPDQELEFKDGYQAIGDAFSQGTREVMALSAGASLDDVRFEPSEIEAYTVDVAPSWQEVIDFETLSGKKTSVTKNHPLLTSDGMMRYAQDLKVGDSLVLADGAPDPIVRADTRNYYGKVYNIRLINSNPAQNIVVDQGLLSGSVYFQNEGTRDLNRQLFRVNLPAELVQ
jgi:hypothetical protein